MDLKWQLKWPPIRRKTAEELEYEIEMLRYSAEAYERALDSYRPSRKRSNSPVVSTKTVTCHETDEEHTAVLLVHTDGAITVKCPAACVICDYERLL